MSLITVAFLLPNSWQITKFLADSIKNASRIVAYGLVKYYTGNITNTESTIGILPAPYYWWEAGAQWGALLDYYHYTGDSTYNNITTQALLSQVGPLFDYMVPAHQKDEGNDDQAFWGFATMSAAEKDYPQPTIGKYSWLELTENLWNTQVRRWDTTSCGGGLKWQIFTFNNGYDYKNAVSNGAFFQLSARLARFTANQTYVEWAEKAWDWSTRIGLVDSGYYVYDGSDDLENCSDVNKLVWTYNTGVYMYGAAVLYNYTNGSALWKTRTQGFLDTLPFFFDPYKNTTNVMYEPPCETVNTCNNDQFSFKGYLSRFYWASTLMAPFTTSAVTTLLTGSALAAARSCSGGFDGVTCGQHWYWDVAYDNSIGIGQQMSALETIQGLLVKDSIPPLHGDQVHLRVVPTTSQAPVPSKTSTPPVPTPTTSKGAAMVTNAPSWMLPSIPLAILGMGVL
jgi:mannan endo-1,6-alpha-mannosidase